MPNNYPVTIKKLDRHFPAGSGDVNTVIYFVADPGERDANRGDTITFSMGSGVTKATLVTADDLFDEATKKVGRELKAQQWTYTVKADAAYGVHEYAVICEDGDIVRYAVGGSSPKFIIKSSPIV